MNTETPYGFSTSRYPDWDQVEAVVRRAEQMRAAWVGSALSRLWTWLTRPVKVAFAPMLEARNRRLAIEELLELDSRLLDDIGFRRSDLLAVRAGKATLGEIAPKAVCPAPLTADVVTFPVRGESARTEDEIRRAA